MKTDYDFNGPYSHRLHAARCREAAQAGQLLDAPTVQVRSHGTFLCGVIQSAWMAEGGREMWKVQGLFPLTTVFHSPTERVRLCGGIDDQCSCEQDLGRSGARACDARPSGPKGLTC